MNYKPYPKASDTPSRKARKSSRSSTFLHNRYKLRAERAQARRERKAAREAALEAAQETTLENE